MKIVTQIQAQPEDRQGLLLLMVRFNQACNYASEIAYHEGLFHWLPLQRRVYHELRLRFNVSAAEATVIVRKVAYAYSDKSRRNRLATFQSRGAITLFRHVYYDDQTVRFYGIRSAYVARAGVVLPKHPKEGTLSYRDGKFFIHQVIEVSEPPIAEPRGYLGCDLGIVNILADNVGEAYSSGQLNGLRHRHFKLRQRLGSKGTRSAKRLLRKRRWKEGRFGRDVNHCISKKVVTKAKTASLGIALENLTGIREHVKVRKAQRRQHHSWSFNQLRQFIEYKAKLAGVKVVLVDPRNTSRECPACGYTDKRNRPTQAEFRCLECGFSGSADIVAATNISRRVAGNQPYAAPSSVAASPLTEDESEVEG